MTALEVAFRYGRPPEINEMRALDALREVYGVRRIQLNEADHVIRLEYDASRLKESVVASLLRRAGLDLQDKVAAAPTPA